MEQSNDMHTVHRSQGAVATLKRLKLLREEVNGRDKDQKQKKRRKKLYKKNCFNK